MPSRPRTVEEFRRLTPLTTYADYAPDLSARNESALAVKPASWVCTSGRGGSIKWIPWTETAMEIFAEAGIAAGILACANLIPAQWQEVYRAIRAGEWETARAGQLRAQRVSRIVGSGGSLAVRAGLKLRGIPVGPPRQPLALEGAVREADLAVLSEALG